MSTSDLSRRTFIQTSLAAGGGMLLGFHIPGVFAARGRAAAMEDADQRRRDQRVAHDRQKGGVTRSACRTRKWARVRSRRSR